MHHPHRGQNRHCPARADPAHQATRGGVGHAASDALAEGRSPHDLGAGFPRPCARNHARSVACQRTRSRQSPGASRKGSDGHFTDPRALAAAGLRRAGAAAMPDRYLESRGRLQPPASGRTAYRTTRSCTDDQPAADHGAHLDAAVLRTPGRAFAAWSERYAARVFAGGALRNNSPASVAAYASRRLSIRSKRSGDYLFPESA